MLSSKSFPLKEGGDDIQVTNENKEEYISSMIDFHTSKSVQPYISIFLKAIHAVRNIIILFILAYTLLAVLNFRAR